MTDQVEEIKETALQGVDGFFTKLTEAADIVTAKLIAVAPEAAEAILNLVQFKGAFNIAGASVCAIAAIILLRYAIKSIKSSKFTDDGFFEDAQSGMSFAFGIICGLPIIILSCVAFSGLSDFYNWLSAFYPEGAIALKALEAVGVNL